MSQPALSPEALAFVHQQQEMWRPVMDKISAKAK